MKKVLAALAGGACLSALLPALPALALSCAQQYPTTGRISSLTEQYGYTTFVLSNTDVYNAQMFLTDALNVEQYNNFVSAYVNNNFSTPAAYAYQNTQGSDLATIRANAQQQGISLSNAELNAVNYKVGDIAVMGLPQNTGLCSQYGTVLIYDSGANPKSAVTAANSVTLGTETLQIAQISHATPGAYDCATSSGNSTCYMPANGSLNGATFSINPGQSRTFASGRFGQLDLLKSTYTTFTGFSWSGPIDFKYTLNFRSITPIPTPACTSVWSCSSWSSCSTSPTGSQSRTCTDANACATPTSPPATAQQCTPQPATCQPSWSCSAWSACSQWGTQMRACTDLNGCVNSTTQPVTGQQCSPSVIPVPLPSPTPTSCPILSRNLSLGSRGNDVLALQQYLTNKGYLPTPLVGTYLTGYFGFLTEAGVKQFQTEKGIASSGTPATTGFGAVGPRTRAALASCNAY